MLIIDLNTLQTIYTLHFADHVILHGTYTLDLENIMWIYATFCERLTFLQSLTL